VLFLLYTTYATVSVTLECEVQIRKGTIKRHFYNM